MRRLSISAFALRAGALLLPLVAAPPGGAAEAPKPAGALAPSRDWVRDVQLARKVREALKEDATLSLAKLWVSVKDRVAVLEGEVSSEEQLRAAVKRVEQVRGLAGVRSEGVRVAAPQDDPLTIPLLPEPPSRTRSHFPDRSGVPARPTTLPREVEPVPEVVRVTLQPPVPLPPPKNEAVTTLRTSAPPGEVPSAAVERARQHNPRFRELQVEVRGEVVWLRGTTGQVDAGMEFARALTDLGVRHVVIQCDLPAVP